jgi:hypothetical protein
MDPITLVNLILTIVLLIMGIWAYTARRSRSMLYIGIAFGLFALTHLITLIGLAAGMAGFILVVRILAYLLAIYAIYIVIAKKKDA